jgi:hypothetical protein
VEHALDYVTDIRILDVAIDPDDKAVVLLDVYGSARNVCGTIEYRFPDARTRNRQVAVLRAWAHRDTPVTMVTNGTVITLLDEDRFFAGALDSLDV